MNDTIMVATVERKPGFAIWGWICLMISVFGFWPSYVAPSFAGTYSGLSTLIHWHVLFTTLWLVLMISQSTLVQTNRVDLHRLFGLFGVVVATGVVFTGVVVQIDVMAPYAERNNLRSAVGLPFFRLVQLLIFVICVALAIALRNSRPDWHKRLMILGTFALLQAPLVRMYENVFEFREISGLLGVVSHIILMVLLVIWDRRTQGKFHPATLWGTILITLIVFGVGPIP